MSKNGGIAISLAATVCSVPIACVPIACVVLNRPDQEKFLLTIGALPVVHQVFNIIKDLGEKFPTSEMGMHKERPISWGRLQHRHDQTEGGSPLYNNRKNNPRSFSSTIAPKTAINYPTPIPPFCRFTENKEEQKACELTYFASLSAAENERFKTANQALQETLHQVSLQAAKEKQRELGIMIPTSTILLIADAAVADSAN